MFYIRFFELFYEFISVWIIRINCVKLSVVPLLRLRDYFVSDNGITAVSPGTTADFQEDTTTPGKIDSALIIDPSV